MKVLINANQDHCPACLQNGCEDYVWYRQTHTLSNRFECPFCSNTYYGPTCFEQHSVKTYDGTTADATHPLSVERYNDAVSVENGPYTMAVTRTNLSTNVITKSVRPAWITSILLLLDVTSRLRMR